MKSEDLRARLALEAKIRAPDGGGGVVESWTQAAELWGAMTPLAGGEIVTGGGVEDRVSWRITVRNPDCGAGPAYEVTPAMRFVWRGRVFNIRSVAEMGANRAWLRCECEEAAPS